MAAWKPTSGARSAWWSIPASTRKHWTREQMVDYFHQHSAVAKPMYKPKWIATSPTPAQALGYKVGQLKLLELRAKAQQALGDRFDLRAFHDQVLDSGALPLDLPGAAHRRLDRDSKKHKSKQGDFMGGYTTRQPLAGLRVAILGAGKMGGILLQAFLKSKVLEPEQIMATVEHEDRAGQLSAQWGVDVSTDNVAAAQGSGSDPDRP